MAVVRDDFVDYCVELLGGPVTTRAKRMFGGYGLYFDGLFIAIVFNDQLYLKANDAGAILFEQAGGSPLRVHASAERPIHLKYWSVPPEAMDSAAMIEPWRRLAVEAALAAPPKTPRKKKPRVKSP
ncbi:TfoX/Sxy family protein [Paraburkholderia sp.]|uniref:TfoX/Sxy family protein n=1 Tax=Paraburkholderia sp. TaxID=1926495 RepID=UPI002390CC44|nr:TfoX/Sxy family protein [Paraburkholderia sp.]MDE1182363.1 TfoX/Sxy family protein [Paraburkholderia sp.]